MKKFILINLIALLLLLNNCSNKNNPLSPQSDFFKNLFLPSTAKAKFVVYEIFKPSTFDMELWYVNTDGTGNRKLTLPLNCEASGFYAITRNGEKVIYDIWNWDTNQYEIWSINIDGSKPLQLAVGNMRSLSADGTKIIYEFNSIHYLMNSDGSSKKQIFTDNSQPSKIEFSFDSKKIAYTKTVLPFDLWVANIDGSGSLKIKSADIYAPILNCFWSPNGNKIVYTTEHGVSGPFSSTNAIFIINSDGSDNKQLTDYLVNYNLISWRPYQDIIVYKYEYPLVTYYKLSTSGSLTQIYNLDSIKQTIAYDQFGYIYAINNNYGNVGVPVKIE